MNTWANRSCLIISLVLFLLFMAVFVFVIPAVLKFAPEARNNLGDIFDQQAAYHKKHNKFASGERCFEDLGWKPASEIRYSYYCSQSYYPCTRCDIECPVPTIGGASDQGFTIIAVGNIDKDPECDVWIINDTGKLVHMVSDLE